ncbi:hypothetical protein CASFOL_031602 [Castilleja foliolosa]|uniref:Uncharacterized protein n=1 Tax=Castilleja foliolosa TaxID=1961234 RepID=A0ABD3C658_9LAMI
MFLGVEFMGTKLSVSLLTSLANSSYLLFDHPFRAKVPIDGCLKSDSPRVASHTKLTNTSDLTTFLKSIFSCGKQGFWNCVPIIRRGRTADTNGVLFDGPRAAYETELKDFVKKLSTKHYVDKQKNAQRNAQPPDYQETEPTIVGSLKNIKIGDEVTKAARGVFALLDYRVSVDLRITGFYRLKCPYILLNKIRNFNVHGLSLGGLNDILSFPKGRYLYQSLDRDILKGFDMYMSCIFPDFFMQVYEVAKRRISVNDSQAFRKYLDLSFDPCNSELGSGCWLTY